MPADDESVTIAEVDPATAYTNVEESDGVILDVREHEELAQVSLPDALHIPLGELHLRIDDVPRDRDVYVLCHVGQRSAMATALLQQIGHERVHNIRGGVIGWLRAGLPATRSGQS